MNARERPCLPFALGQPYEQTTHVTIVVTQDSATAHPTEYLRERHSFPTVEAAGRYAERLREWVAERPDPADEPPAPMLGETYRPLSEILDYERDDHRYLAPAVVPGPFDWVRS